MRALPLVLCAFLGAPASAEAGTGLYLQLGLGYGGWSGTELVTREAGGVPAVGEGCCPSGTLAAQTRLGFKLFGSVAIEGLAFGSGWNLDSDRAGAGFLGGGLRLFPLGFLDALKVLDMTDFPIEPSIGLAGAWAVVGSDDYAYRGAAFGIDLAVDYRIASFFSVGARLDVWFPSYDAFALTSWNANRGFCLDGNADFNLEVGEIEQSDQGVRCGAGRGPSTTVVSPQVFMTFHFDIL